jgi:hypothetical protein
LVAGAVDAHGVKLVVEQASGHWSAQRIFGMFSLPPTVKLGTPTGDAAGRRVVTEPPAAETLKIE